MFMSGLLALGVFAALTWLDLRNLHPKRPELPWGNILNFNLLWLLVAAAIVLELTLQNPNSWLDAFFKKAESASGWTLAMQFGVAFLVQKSLTQGAFILAACRMAHFEVSYKGQMRLIFWASLGFILMRLVLQAWEWKLLSMVGWFVYALTPFLFYYGFLLLHTRHDSFSLEEDPLLNAVNKFLPLSESVTVNEPTGLNGAGQKSRERAKIDEIFFFKRKQGVLHMTPLFSLLLIVLLAFLLCSFTLLPAVWAITQDHSVIFFSNLASILGLGSGYLWTAKNLHRLRHVKDSIGYLSIFLATLTLLSPWISLSPSVILLIIGVFFATGTGMSFFFGQKDTAALLPPLPISNQKHSWTAGERTFLLWLGLAGISITALAALHFFPSLMHVVYITFGGLAIIFVFLQISLLKELGIIAKTEKPMGRKARALDSDLESETDMPLLKSTNSVKKTEKKTTPIPKSKSPHPAHAFFEEEATTDTQSHDNLPNDAFFPPMDAVKEDIPIPTAAADESLPPLPPSYQDKAKEQKTKIRNPLFVEPEAVSEGEDDLPHPLPKAKPKASHPPAPMPTKPKPRPNPVIDKKGDDNDDDDILGIIRKRS